MQEVVTNEETARDLWRAAHQLLIARFRLESVKAIAELEEIATNHDLAGYRPGSDTLEYLGPSTTVFTRVQALIP